MKTTIKQENDEFLVISFKHESGRKGNINSPRTPKLWAIANENGHKTRKLRVFGHISKKCKGSYMPCKSNWNQKPHKNGKKHENDKFLGITLKHVSGLKVALTSHRTIKMWAIAHENSHKTRKRRVSGHIF